MQRAADTNKNLELGLSAFYRIAAFASIQAKQEKWEVEQEYRHTTITFQKANVQPCETNITRQDHQVFCPSRSGPTAKESRLPRS